MDGTSFDRMARLLGATASRRTGLFAAVGMALGLTAAASEEEILAGDAADDEAEAEKKKKKRKRCRPSLIGKGTKIQRRRSRCRRNKNCCSLICMGKRRKKKKKHHHKKDGELTGLLVTEVELDEYGFDEEGYEEYVEEDDEDEDEELQGFTFAGDVEVEKHKKRRRRRRRRCRCRKAGATCKRDVNCCKGRSCVNGTCRGQAEGKVPTGESCDGGSDTCQNAAATCTRYRSGKPSGTYCLLPDGKRCTANAECEGQSCVDGTCQASAQPKIPTGQACGPKDECEDPLAECTTYDTGNPAGTYCLKQLTETCTADVDCQTQYCNTSGVCDCMVCTGGTCKYATIQAAIDAEPVSGIISIKQGSYTEKFTANKTQTLRGCMGARVTMAGDSQQSPVATLNSSATVTMIGFDISGNTGDNAIYVTDSATLDLRDSTVNGNKRGVETSNGNLTIDGSTFDGNSDGGIWVNRDAGFDNDPVYRNTLTVTNTTVQNNTTQSNNPSGILAQYATVTITDCTVKNNAGQWGSGIACWTETTTTIGGATVVEGNTGKGGTGVYAACYVSDRSSTMTIGGTTQIKNNVAEVVGGGLGLDLGSTDTNTNVTVIVKDDVVISGNSAENGGGIWIDAQRGADGKSNLTLKDRVQVTNNTASCSFGGVLVEGPNSGNGGSMTMEGSASVKNNTATKWIGGVGVTVPSGRFTFTGVASASVNGNTQQQYECAYNINDNCTPSSATNVANCNF